jgi:hypothetical protein
VVVFEMQYCPRELSGFIQLSEHPSCATSLSRRAWIQNNSTNLQVDELFVGIVREDPDEL